MQTAKGQPFPLGATLIGNGLNGAASSEVADAVEVCLDGRRFDLATTLTRQSGEADIHSAFLALIHQDPVLAPVKMIAEPWDVAGSQVGGFPARWSEWNGRYRDTVRDFWRGGRRSTR